MSEQNVSIVDAEKLTGKSRKTIYRDIKTGKVSSTSDGATGNKTINISELIRVYGALKPLDETERQSKPVLMSQPETALNSELDSLRQRLKLIDAENESLRQRLIDKDKVIELQERLLQHLPTTTEPIKPIEPETIQPIEPEPKKGIRQKLSKLIDEIW